MTARFSLETLLSRAHHDMMRQSGRCARSAALHAREGNAGEVYPVARNHCKWFRVERTEKENLWVDDTTRRPKLRKNHKEIGGTHEVRFGGGEGS